MWRHLNGEDVNTSPAELFGHQLLRLGQVLAITHFPFEIVESVQPERQRLGSDGKFKPRKPLPQKWWIYADKRPAWHAALEGMSRALVITQSQASPFSPYSFQSELSLQNCLYVFLYEDNFIWCVSTSDFHCGRSVQCLSADSTRRRPTDCFETFPQPTYSEAVEDAGRALDHELAPVLVERTSCVLDGFRIRWGCGNVSEQSVGASG